MKGKIIRPTGGYPCQWDDLVDIRGNTIITIYTENEAKVSGIKSGIRKAKDGIYNLVVHSNEINNEVVRNALKKLSKKTKQDYKFLAKKTLDDKIINYADKLMKPSEKYKDSEGDYDFSSAKTPKEKAEIIMGWIGEILYEGETYKDKNALESLVKTIKIEIKELIKQ